jgi:hypothetical protein
MLCDRTGIILVYILSEFLLCFKTLFLTSLIACVKEYGVHSESITQGSHNIVYLNKGNDN